MESSDSEDAGNDSDVVLLDDDEDIETDVSDTEVDGDVSSRSDSTSDLQRDADYEPVPVSSAEILQNEDYLSDTEVEGEISSHSDSTDHRDAESEPFTVPENQISQNGADLSFPTTTSAQQPIFYLDGSTITALPSFLYLSHPPAVIAETATITTETSPSQPNSIVVAVPSTSSSSSALSNLAPRISTTSENLTTSSIQVASTSLSETTGQAVLLVDENEEESALSVVKTTISSQDSPRGKKRKKECRKDEPADSEEDSNGQTCSICMDEWSNSGAHRLCCLRCGHIYGESCIRRWLTSTAASSGRCPQCNAKAKLRDIRPLFARSLRAIDTAERDRLASQLEETRRERERLELEITRITMSHQMQQAQVSKLQAELELLRKGRVGAIIAPESRREGVSGEMTGDGSQIPTAFEGIARDGSSCHFTLRSTVEIAREGGCRVAAYSESLNLVVVSQRSTNPLFPGFGVKKVDALEFRATQFVPAHPKPIRDLAFAPPTAVRCLLLSASFDCTARLLDVGGGSNAVVATLSADTPLWSCCWDACDPNLLHVGTQGGVVLSFDVRRTSAPVSRISDPDDITPVISLVPVPPSPRRALPLGGLLSCHLSSCWAHDPSTDTSLRLPLEGPFTALRYEHHTQHFLVSARPSARTPHARHSVCERALRGARRSGESSEGSASSFSICNPPIHTFLGGTSQRVLSRPCLLPVGRDLVVGAHQESSSTVALWSVGTGSRVATIPASDPVIDVCPVNINGDTHVALLTEKMLRLYRIH